MLEMLDVVRDRYLKGVEEYSLFLHRKGITVKGVVGSRDIAERITRNLQKRFKRGIRVRLSYPEAIEKGTLPSDGVHGNEPEVFSASA